MQKETPAKSFQGSSQLGILAFFFQFLEVISGC